jgi:hypothetical protein
MKLIYNIQVLAPSKVLSQSPMQNSSSTSMAYPQQECIPHPHAGIDFLPFLGISNVWRRGHIAAAIVLLCALYSYAVLRAVKPGLPRLLLGLPVLAGIHAVPLLFHPVLEPLATISATFLAVRLTSGKVRGKIVMIAQQQHQWQQGQQHVPRSTRSLVAGILVVDVLSVHTKGLSARPQSSSSSKHVLTPGAGPALTYLYPAAVLWLLLLIPSGACVHHGPWRAGAATVPAAVDCCHACTIHASSDDGATAAAAQTSHSSSSSSRQGRRRSSKHSWCCWISGRHCSPEVAASSRTLGICLAAGHAHAALQH